MTDTPHSTPSPPRREEPTPHALPGTPSPPRREEPAPHALPGAPSPPRPDEPAPYASGYQDLPTLPEEVLRTPGNRNLPAPRRVLRRPWVAQLTAFAILLAVWQYLTVTSGRVPSIETVVSFMYTEITGGSHGGLLFGEFWGPLGLSLQRYAIGLAIGIPVGAVLGLLIGSSTWIRGLLNDTTLVLLALPAVVWAFLASLWFGLTSTAPIVAVALTAIPFVAINFSSGVRNIDPSLIEMSKSYKVSRRNRIVNLLLGGTLPNAFTGVRLAFNTGWNSLLIVEWFGATNGVGWRARFWYDALRYPGFVGWVFLFVLLITLLDRLVLRRLERHAFEWNQQPTPMFAEDPVM